MYAPTSTSNKNKLVPKGKLVKPSEKKSNFDFLLLCSNAPTRPRPCQSITLIYFHHPIITPKLLPLIFLVVSKHYRKNLFYYKKQKYIKHTFIFSITWKPCIHLPICFRRRCIWLMVTCSSTFSKFQCTVSKKLASLTFSNFCIFSICVHPFKQLFHGEMHMDDGKMPKQFQKIPVHSFQEICLHHLQPFLVFLEIRASIDQKFSMWRCIMIMETCSKSFSSI